MKRLFYALLPTVRQFFKFGLIGIIGFLVDYAFFHLGYDLLHLGPYGSAFFSFPFAVTTTWFGNRRFTFRDQNQGSAHSQWARFFVVCAVGLVINRGAFIVLTYTLPIVQEFPVLGLLGGTAASMFFNFFSARRFVFRA